MTIIKLMLNMKSLLKISILGFGFAGVALLAEYNMGPEGRDREWASGLERSAMAVSDVVTSPSQLATNLLR